jgi:ribonuclease P/MRP protein subunit POP1
MFAKYIIQLFFLTQPSKANKRPSRKYRRRPVNLLSEYERRKKADQMWLETHIWHAKRFHMIKLHNYKLALHDNCKNLRPMYRSLNKNCVIHVCRLFLQVNLL